MKIAVIGVKGIPAKQGGIEHYCQALYPKIVEQGHTVDLYARSSYINESWFSIYECQGVRVICLPSLAFRGLDAFTNSALAAVVTAFKGYDVIHFHALGPSLFSVIPRLLSSAKIVATCQGLDWQRGKWGKSSSRVIRLGEKMAARYAHNVIVVSKALQDYFKQTYDLDTEYIPNAPGIYSKSDPDFNFIKSLGIEPNKYLLFLGRLVPEKRPDLLLQAFQKLQQSDWKLVLVGGCSDTTEYIAQLQDLAGDNPQVIFAGELRGTRLAEIVRGAGIFVLPSDLEGLPLAMLEAMREDVPVVASDIPPHQQLIGNDRGSLFKAGDIDSCTAVLAEAINQPQQLASLAEKARKYVCQNYTWDKITADNLAVYDQEFNLDQEQPMTVEVKPNPDSITTKVTEKITR
jgi:glycosyltransferase involved in cell wall biosynthesis